MKAHPLCFTKQGQHIRISSNKPNSHHGVLKLLQLPSLKLTVTAAGVKKLKYNFILKGLENISLNTFLCAI
jgi:hypothetical protein